MRLNYATTFNIITFLSIMLIVGFLKYDVLFSDVIILDDMQYFSASIFGNLQDRSIYFWVFSLHNRILENPAYIRFLYLTIFSICGLSLYIILNKTLKDRLASLLITLLVFLNPTTTIMLIFVNGSYNVLFLLLFIVGLYLLSSFVLRYYSLKQPIRLLLFSSGCLLVSLSTFFTSNGIFLPLAIIFLPWWNSQFFSRNKKKLLTFLGIFLFSVGLATYFSVLAIFDNHPYTVMSGRLVYEPLTMLKNSMVLFLNVINSYIAPPASTGISYSLKLNVSSIILMSVIFGFISMFFIGISAFNSKNCFKRNQPIISALPFLVMLIIFSIAPLSPITIIHLWHYFLPSIFILLFILLIVFILIGKKYFYRISFLLVIISAVSLLNQIKPYDKAFAEQENLVNFVKAESVNWKSNAQVVIVTEKTSFMSGLGQLPYRDLGFLRFQTKRSDINFAYVGTKNIIRKSDVLINISKTEPLYLYEFNYSDNTAKKLSHMLVQSKGFLSLYNLSNFGINLVDKGTADELSTILNNNNLQDGEYLFINESGNVRDYAFINESVSVDFVEYEGDYFRFEKEGYVQEKVDISDDPSVLYFEFMLNLDNNLYSDNNLCGRTPKYTGSCPYMPLLSPPLAVYQTKNNELLFQIKHKYGDKYIRYSFIPGQWQKFSFTLDFQAKSVDFFINDNLFTKIESIEIGASKVKYVRLGSGYKNRLWQGKISHFSIYKLVNKNERIYYLDLKK